MAHYYRKLPVGVEVAHCGEAYHNVVAWPGWLRGYKVELSTLASSDFNESQKYCNRYGLMWRKPDSTIIPEAEIATYAGPTLCFHRAVGVPCCGPHPPPDEHVPTFETVKRLKRGRFHKPGGSGGAEAAAHHPFQQPPAQA
jgi:hypothetical protein